MGGRSRWEVQCSFDGLTFHELTWPHKTLFFIEMPFKPNWFLFKYVLSIKVNGLIFIILVCKRTAKKGSKDAKQKTSEAEPAKKKNTYRRKLASKPVDDVYLTWLYERPVYDAEVAVDMLKKFQQLDFTYPKQHVYANLTLDMMLEKKVC